MDRKDEYFFKIEVNEVLDGIIVIDFIGCIGLLLELVVLFGNEEGIVVVVKYNFVYGGFC